MARRIYTGDVGIIIDIDMRENIEGATNIILKVKTPRGVIKTWDAELYGTNHIRYLIEENDIAEPGMYKLQPMLTLGNWVGHGNTVKFVVYSKFR